MDAHLWAKSWDSVYGNAPPHVFLPGHLRDVYRAAERVVSCTGKDQLGAVGVDSAQYFDRFRRIVLLAAAVHDLGKANDHFQEMLAGRRDVRSCPQGLRHEWVTLLMLRLLEPWLLPALDGQEIDLQFVEWAVTGHHPGCNHSSPPRQSANGAGTTILLLTDHPDYRTSLLQLQELFRLEDPPCIDAICGNLVGKDNVFDQIAAWSLASRRTWDRLSWEVRHFVATIKVCLIAADVAGSALPRALSEASRWDWIDGSFAATPQPGDLQTVVDCRLEGCAPRAFQLSIASSGAQPVLVKAGCGTGKTLAAYMWAAANHPCRRLYFCYPTTGTATEGFRDYLFDADEGLSRIGARLFHSRSAVDFELILTAGMDIDRAHDEALSRLQSLEAWATPVVACTVDCVLGLIQNNKRGLFAWPALAHSAFVFDEIHAYDERLFGALLRFLRDLPGLPVLLMTASLPKTREDALRDVLDTRGLSLSVINGPEDMERRPRYHKATIVDNDPLPHVQSTLATGGKVLWVCNTVSRVMEAAARPHNLQPLLYHSRFKYEHRLQRHKAVIEAFRGDGPALAICSQVAEMSLDLSADLLVTDLATIPALIQRLGRLNRRAREGEPTKPFVVVTPENGMPYDSVDLVAANQWLTSLPDSRISQRHLSEAWEQTGDDPSEAIRSAWLDGGPITTVTELREASVGITVLMNQDLPRAKARPKELVRLTLPMPPPRNDQWRTWPTFLGIPVTPDDCVDYDETRGAQWAK